MPTFTVHAPPRTDGAPASPERFLFVRDGFHGWAFLLGPFWLIRYQLWLALVLYAIGMVALIAGLAALRANSWNRASAKTSPSKSKAHCYSTA